MRQRCQGEEGGGTGEVAAVPPPVHALHTSTEVSACPHTPPGPLADLKRRRGGGRRFEGQALPSVCAQPRFEKDPSASTFLWRISESGTKGSRKRKVFRGGSLAAPFVSEGHAPVHYLANCRALLSSPLKPLEYIKLNHVLLYGILCLQPLLDRCSTKKDLLEPETGLVRHSALWM